MSVTDSGQWWFLLATSDVAKALLGKDADTLIALAVVGAAMAAALVAAGPVILSATKTKASDEYTVMATPPLGARRSASL